MKIVLITDTNKGIGFETARQMALLGYFVYLGCRSEKKRKQAMEVLHEMGILNAMALQLDVTDQNSIQQAKNLLESREEALDILINNAAIAEEQLQNRSLEKIDIFREVLETNFFAVVQTTRQFMPLLRKSERPTIVNVCGQLGSLTLRNMLTEVTEIARYDAYSCSKEALNTFTLLLGCELKDTNFQINSVELSYTATDLNPYKHTQSVEKSANLIIQYARSGLNKAPITGRFLKQEMEMLW